MLATYTEDFLDEIYKSELKITYSDQTDLYLELEDAKELAKNIKVKQLQTVKISSLIQSEYGVEEIKNYIKANSENKKNKAYIYSFKIENDNGIKREIKLIFVDYQGLSVNVYNKYAERVFLVLYLLRNTSDSCSNLLTIYCYMTHFKKLLPESRSVVLSSRHINTGITYQCIKNNEVCVYRHEEWFKVLIHELFHAHGADIKISFSPKQFYTNSKILVGEAYVEFWGSYLNNVICAYYLAKEHNNLNNINNIFSEYLAKFIRAERIFSLIQVNKILRHNNMSYNDFFKPKNRYREETNVFAYYILKSIFLFNYYNFMVKSMKHNNNNYSVIDDKYIETFIEKYAKNREYRKYLNELNVDYMNKSLRMTIIELL